MASLQKYHDDFYVYLVSNSNPHLYPQNTASSFINEIQVPINFGSNLDQWEVGISELLFPSKFFNITEGVNEFKVRYPLTPEQARERRSQRAEVPPIQPPPPQPVESNQREEVPKVQITRRPFTA